MTTAVADLNWDAWIVEHAAEAERERIVGIINAQLLVVEERSRTSECTTDGSAEREAEMAAAELKWLLTEIER